MKVTIVVTLRLFINDKKTRSVYAGAHHVEENILPVCAGLLRILAGIILLSVFQITKIYEV